MCFFINTKEITKKIKKDSNLILSTDAINYSGETMLNGFSFPETPVIFDIDPEKVVLAEWGLVPEWSKNKEIQKYTLNARIETLIEKPSFKNSVNKRCLIPVTNFYEWKWLDEKGKQKQQYHISLKDHDYFFLGGIYSQWVNTSTREIVTTYSQITTEANPLMAEIHNTKKRMPVILSNQTGKNWLTHRNILDFSYPNYNPELTAF